MTDRQCSQASKEWRHGSVILRCPDSFGAAAIWDGRTGDGRRRVDRRERWCLPRPRSPVSSPILNERHVGVGRTPVIDSSRTCVSRGASQAGVPSCPAPRRCARLWMTRRYTLHGRPGGKKIKRVYGCHVRANQNRGGGQAVGRRRPRSSIRARFPAGQCHAGMPRGWSILFYAVL